MQSRYYTESKSQVTNRTSSFMISGYDHFGVSRKGSEDTSDEHCTILYDKEKVKVILLPCNILAQSFV